MAKPNHWLDQHDVMVPFILIGIRKVKLHCHNHVIQLEKEELEELKLPHVTKDTFAACICERINRRNN